MPANQHEIIDAEDEGVDIHYLASPIRILGKKGAVSGMKCIRNRLGKPDTSGRRRPVPVKGTEFIIDTDTVIPAISQHPDLSFLPQDHGFNLTRWNTFEVNPQTLQTNIEGIFAGGDAVTGSATVIEAMAAGKKAAIMIDRYISRQPLREITKLEHKNNSISSFTNQEIKGIRKRKREIMPKLSLSLRKTTFNEVELGFTEEMAMTEAQRCLRCWMK
jgi:NADPH-dependent glutamate synthase beta subunit-like oxidoreductase